MRRKVYCIMKEILVVLIAVTVQGTLAHSISTYYITRGPYSDENETEEVFLQWSTIQHNISRYLTSHTEICFLSGEYNFDQRLTIESVNNVSIIGKSAVTFKCTNDTAIFINDSIAVRIHNVKFVNCGVNEAYFVNDIPFIFKTTISLLNVQSIVLSNITFQNSFGHGIVGINVLGSSTLVNITVYHNNNLSGNSLRPMGGIILVYVDTIDGVHHNQIQLENNVLIQNCIICCMSEQPNLKLFTAVNGLLISSLMGLYFHQQMFKINVAIVNFSIKDITSQNTPLVYTEYNSSMANSVSINKSKFTNIVSTNYPIIFLNFTPADWNHPHKSITYFQLSNCLFQLNTANFMQFNKLIKNAQLIVRFEIISTVFSYNKAAESHWILPTHEEMALITITNCTFVSNSGFKICIKGIHNVTLIDTLFYNNSLQHSAKTQGLLVYDKTVPIFEGHNKFSFNTADVIISLNSWIFLREGATLDISNNNALNVKSTQPKSLIYFKERLDNYPCIFQFLLRKGSLDEGYTNNNSVNFSVVFRNNHNYTSILYDTVLNSCHWRKQNIFQNSTPGDVYKSIVQFDMTTNIIARQEVTFCYCDNITEADCLKDNFTTTPIYPGQIIPINLVQVSTRNITPTVFYFWQNVAPARSQHNLEPCQLMPYQPTNWSQSIHKSCVPLFYRVFTNTSEPCSACFSVASFNHYCYPIGFRKSCPHGFEHRNGSCKCNRYLQAAFPSLRCDIESKTLYRRANSWISYSKPNTILFVEMCNTFCTDKPSYLKLDNPNTQCIGHRVGLKCGQCPPGLSATFGSLSCKKCSNDMLWLLPVFFIAGILLVFCLFTLNLTVVDGKINGFILYANLTAVNSRYTFPSSNKVLFAMLSLCNLDLGIETCFYNGMTEYDKTWLQFVFPLYLLCIVGVLAVTSRYSSYVERLTRKRAIPVMATIFLLSYSKILLVTAKVLVSSATVHEIDGNYIKQKKIWLWDSSIQLFGKQYIPLFVVSLLVLLGVLLPLNFCLIFTKTSYRIKFVCEYLKPYLDACQAPLKANHYYYFGIDLLVRPIVFAIGNGILDTLKTLAIYCMVLGVISIYLCGFKPFKNNTTALLYISYAINLGCEVILFMYYGADTTSTAYGIIFKTLIIIALTEFGCTVLYYLYIGHLYEITSISYLIAKLTSLMSKFQSWFIGKPTETAAMTQPATIYAQLREEMLTADPDN